MKHLFLSLVFILSATHIAAQVRTGGGGGPDIDSNDQRVAEYEAMMKAKYEFHALTKELIRIETKCLGRKSVPANYNFIDSFYSLGLKKPGDFSECAPSKKVAHCLDSKVLKSIMGQISTIPNGPLYKYLKKEHKLDEKSATTILKFFKRP
jgi:hypothetical protein